MYCNNLANCLINPVAMEIACQAITKDNSTIPRDTRHHTTLVVYYAPYHLLVVVVARHNLDQITTQG